MAEYAIEMKLVEVTETGKRKKKKFSTLQVSWSGTFTDDQTIAQRVIGELSRLEDSLTKQELKRRYEGAR